MSDKGVMKVDRIKILKYLFYLSVILAILNVVLIFVPDEPQNSQTPKVESIKLGDKANKVIIDDVTGCKYIVFNNKTLTPLYNKQGKVDGCGKFN